MFFPLRRNKLCDLSWLFEGSLNAPRQEVPQSAAWSVCTLLPLLGKGSLISIRVKQGPGQALTFMKKKNVAVAHALHGLDVPQHSAAILTCQKLLTTFCSAAQIVALSGGFPFISHGFLKSPPQTELDPTCFKPKRAFHNNPFWALFHLLCI